MLQTISQPFYTYVVGQKQDKSQSITLLSESALLNIPSELLLNILSFLSPLELSGLCSIAKSVCKQVTDFTFTNAKFVFKACKEYEETLARLFINALDASPTKTLACSILNLSDTAQKIRENELARVCPHLVEKFEEKVFDKLENLHLSPFQKETLKTLGFDNAELVEILHAIKDPQTKEVFEILQYFEEEQLQKYLKKTSFNKEGCYIFYEGDWFDLDKIYQDNSKTLIEEGNYTNGKDLADFCRSLNKSQSIPEASSSEELAETIASFSREELARYIASFSTTSEICLALAAYYTQIVTTKGSDLASTLTVIRELPQPLKEHFLEKKANIVVNCNLSDEELREVILVAKTPENAKALKALDALVLAETIAYLDHLTPTESPDLKMCLEKIWREILQDFIEQTKKK